MIHHPTTQSKSSGANPGIAGSGPKGPGCPAESSAGGPTDRARFLEYEFDFRSGRLRRHGRTVDLEPNSLRLLDFLLRTQGALVNKDELVQRVWQGAFLSDGALSRAMSRLRKALVDDSRRPRVIETVYGLGYRVVCEVEWVDTAPLDPPHRRRDDAPIHRDGQNATAAGCDELPAGRGQPRTVPRSRAPAILLGLAAAIAAIAGAASVLRSPEDAQPARAETTEPARNVGDGLPRPGRLQLTSRTEVEMQPALSRDGRLLAYVVDRGASSTAHAPGPSVALVLRDLANDEEHELIGGVAGRDVRHPSFSPNGELLVFQDRRRGGLWTVPVAGGASRRLTDFGGRPRWSPHGPWIVFQSRPETEPLTLAFNTPPARSTIWLVHHGTGEVRPVTSAGTPDGPHFAPAWSDDGHAVVFAGDQALWRVDQPIEKPSDPVALTVGMSVIDPTVAPGGDVLFMSYRDSEYGLWSVPLTASEQAPVRLASLSARHPTVAPAGDRAVVTMIEQHSDLWQLGLDGHRAAGTPEPWSGRTSFRTTRPAIEPGGDRVAFVTVTQGTGVALLTSDSKAAAMRTIAKGHDLLHRGAEWLGDELVFPVAADDPARSGGSVCLTAMAPSGARRILGCDDWYRFPTALAPDGAEVAITVFEKGRSRLFVGPTRGGNFGPLGGDTPVAYGVWSPDGNWIAASVKRSATEIGRGDSTQAVLVERATGRLTPLTSSPGRFWPSAWSSDGRRLLLTTEVDGLWGFEWVEIALDGDGAPRAGARWTIYRENTTSARVRHPSLSADGQFLLFERRRYGSDLWSIASRPPASRVARADRAAADRTTRGAARDR